MKTYSNCISCNIGLEPIAHYSPCYDAPGGSVDSFDVRITFPTYPYCEGCEDNIPEECKKVDYINSLSKDEDDDDLPF